LDKFAQNNGFCGSIQCSAKANTNVEESFQRLLGNSTIYLDETIKRGLLNGSGTVTG
jgi:hypothetical protein